MLVPSLDMLLARLRGPFRGRDEMKELCCSVACGDRDPVFPPLPENVVRFACQAVVILMEHVDNETG